MSAERFGRLVFLAATLLFITDARADSACFSLHTSAGPTTKLCVSERGLITSLEGPAGVEHLAAEGYALCSANGTIVHGYDAGAEQSGFGAPLVDQPNGPNTFPITISRDTLDGLFRLTLIFTRRSLRQDNEIHMRITNLTSAPVSGVWVSRVANVNASGTALNRLARTADTALAWTDAGYGLELRSRSEGVPHTTEIETADGYFSSRSGCVPSSSSPSPDPFDGAARITFDLGTIGGGKGKNLLVSYARF